MNYWGYVELESVEIDYESQKIETEKEIKRLTGQIFGINKKLNNPKFVDNAPEKVINMERKKHSDMSSDLNKLEEQLQSIITQIR